MLTNSSDETKKIAEDLANNYKTHGGVIALSGQLGAGKTTFIQGFAKGLGITDKIISPTFILMRQHPFNSRILYHIDLYRIDSDDVLDLGLNEILGNRDNIILIEWAEKIKNLLPKDTLWVRFEKISDEKREISIRSDDSK